MPIPLVQVSSKISCPNAEYAEGVTVVAELQSPAQNGDGYIIPKTICTNVDENGCFSFDLWPNCNGNAETYYKITATDDCLNEVLSIITIIPESNIPLNLEDISLPINSLSLGQSSGSVASIRRVDTGEGLQGGGDLSTNRTHKLDLTTIVNQELNPTSEFIIPIQDPNVPCNIRYIPIGSLPGLNNTCISIESIAQPGQTEILLTQNVSAAPDNVDLYIEGRRQPPARYTREIVNLPPYNLKITLSEALEGGEELEVVLKENCDVGSGIDASQVTYSGGGNVEDALNALFSATGATAWQIITSGYTSSPSDRLFVDTSGGPLTVNLPASPAVGDQVEIVDITPSTAITGGDLNNSFIVARNGELIMEVADDLVVDQARISVTLIFAGTAFGWRLVE